MNKIMSFFSFFNNNCFIWQDIVEIIFFSIVIYSLTIWLSTDKKKNLVYYFYGVCALFITSHVLHLSTIESFLWAYLPVIAVFFVLIHQKTLQSNFIGLTRTTNFSQPIEHWHTEVIRASKKAIDQKAPLAFIIEKKQSLAGLLAPTYLLQAPIQNNLIQFLISSSTESVTAVWLDHNGYIKGIDTKEKNLSSLLDLIEHTDALLISSSENQLAFYLADKKFEQLSTAHALQFLQSHLKINKGGMKQNEIKKSFHQSQL